MKHLSVEELERKVIASTEQFEQVREQLTATSQQLSNAEEKSLSLEVQLVSVNQQLALAVQQLAQELATHRQTQQQLAAANQQLAVFQQIQQQYTANLTAAQNRITQLELENTNLQLSLGRVMANGGVPHPSPSLSGTNGNSGSSSGNNGNGSVGSTGSNGNLSNDLNSSLQQLSITQIAAATNGFSEGNKLGEGTLGTVYKGAFSGVLVAVRKLSTESAALLSDFKQEMAILSSLKHPNLVRIMGFAEQGIGKYIVYEFVANGSLRDRIDRKNNTLPLTWPQREAIALGIAVGMNFLQTVDPKAPLYHLDLSSSNVLLDDQLLPKISNFGMARLEPSSTVASSTPTSSASSSSSSPSSALLNKGNADKESYSCPDYFHQKKVCLTTDVYSYGCILMELISNQPISSKLRSGIRNVFIKQRDLTPFLDTTINWTETTMKKAIEIARTAVDCIDDDTTERPTFARIISKINGLSS